MPSYKTSTEPVLESGADMRIITLNGKMDAANLEARMQVGSAFAAAQMFPWLSRSIASEVLEGRNPGMFKLAHTPAWVYGFVAFPIPKSRDAHNGRQKYIGVLQTRYGATQSDSADPALIGYSLISMLLWLQVSERASPIRTIALQYPGIGPFGQLEIATVEPLLRILDERFTVHLGVVKGE